MNILFCNFDEPLHSKIIENVGKNLSANKVISLSVINHNLRDEFEYYRHIASDDINLHNYQHKYNEKAVSAGLIKDMLECEELYLQMMDRYELVKAKKISYQERKKFYYKDLSIMKSILCDEEVGCCVFSTIPHIGYDYILYWLCKLYNIMICVTYFAPPVPFKSATVFCLSDIFDPLPGLNGKKWDAFDDRKELPERMQAYIDCYDRKKEDITSFVYFSDFVKTKKRNLFIEIARKVSEKIKNGTLRSSLKRVYISKIRFKQIKRHISKYASNDLENKFFYFPLHYQPECTSLPMGGFYYDQSLIVKLISENLPDDVYLYVKPHPHQSWFLNEKFFDEIRVLRNVRIISDSVNTYELIDKSIGIVGITGTVICEALVRCKPVLMFGYYIWQYAPGVFPCRNKTDVKCAINEVIQEKKKLDINIFKSFLAEIDQYFVNGVMNDVARQIYRISDEENISNIVKLIVNFIKKERKSNEVL